MRSKAWDCCITSVESFLTLNRIIFVLLADVVGHSSARGVSADSEPGFADSASQLGIARGASAVSARTGSEEVMMGTPAVDASAETEATLRGEIERLNKRLRVLEANAASSGEVASASPSPVPEATEERLVQDVGGLTLQARAVEGLSLNEYCQ